MGDVVFCGLLQNTCDRPQMISKQLAQNLSQMEKIELYNYSILS